MCGAKKAEKRLFWDECKVTEWLNSQNICQKFVKYVNGNKILHVFILFFQYVSRYYIGFKKIQRNQPPKQTTKHTRIITDYFLSHLGDGGSSPGLKMSW